MDRRDGCASVFMLMLTSTALNAFLIAKSIQRLAPTSGEVNLHRKLKVGRFDQHFEELLPVEKSPVAFLKDDFGLNDHEARKALGQFGLDGQLHLIRIADLSGGQKARVVFASLSLQQPQVLILDE